MTEPRTFEGTLSMDISITTTNPHAVEYVINQMLDRWQKVDLTDLEDNITWENVDWSLFENRT